jgi:hypothetical protein
MSGFLKPPDIEFPFEIRGISQKCRECRVFSRRRGVWEEYDAAVHKVMFGGRRDLIVCSPRRRSPRHFFPGPLSFLPDISDISDILVHNLLIPNDVDNVGFLFSRKPNPTFPTYCSHWETMLLYITTGG